MLVKNDNIEELSQKLSAQMEADLTYELKLIARRSGWPEDLVDVLSVRMNDTHDLVVDYPDEYKDQIEDEEYGTSTSLPNAAIRPFMLRAQKIVSNVMMNTTIPELFSLIGII